MPPAILVVEDDEPILELMEIMIRKLGYEPVLVPNAIDALEMVAKTPPALILLDIMMMPVNGWVFLEKLRGEFGLVDIPVLLFTASPEIEERMAQLNDHNLGVLHKPVTLDELRAGISRYLR